MDEKKFPIGRHLKKLKTEGLLPFHMPGHKRKCTGPFPEAEACDITEITGYDNLHSPEGIIRESMDLMKEMYGTRESWYLINGSTAGILASMSAVVKPGDKIMIARNCHKAVYNGIRLLRLDPVYIYPEIDPDYGIAGGIKPEDVAGILSENPDIKAVVITSPTYEGVVSDVRGILEAMNRTHIQIPLIVDEAHGAHFSCHPYFPESAVKQGADLVIQSTHKTLPAMTQTALLHLCTDRVAPEIISDRLAIFETSSPSYVLMASAEYGTAFIHDNVEIVEKYVDNLDNFRGKCGYLDNIQVISGKNTDFYDYDRGKVVIYKKGKGKELFDRLRKDFRIEAEMAQESYVVCMTSVMDEKEDFDRLYEALVRINEEYQNSSFKKEENNIPSSDLTKLMISPLPEYQSWECEEMDREEIPLKEAEGRIAAKDVMIYPPGIPIIVAGEKFQKEIVENITSSLYNGYNVVGTESGDSGQCTVQVICD